MNTNVAHALALELMAKHKLLRGDREYGGTAAWGFKFDNAKRRFGLCSHADRVIYLSEPLTALNEEAKVRDTILHEIAHVLAGPRHGHDRVWKMQCLVVGCKPERCYDSAEVETPDAPFEATCPKCKRIVKRHRAMRPGKRQSCGKCSRRFNPAVELLFHRTGTPQPPVVFANTVRTMFGVAPRVFAASTQAAPAQIPEPIKHAPEPGVQIKFDLPRAVEMAKAGRTLSDIAQAMGWPFGYGSYRVREELNKAGIFKIAT